MEKLDAVLKMFYFGFCDISKWIFALRIASDVIRDTNKGDVQSVIHSILNGGVGYAGLYSVVSILNAIQDSFK